MDIKLKTRIESLRVVASRSVWLLKADVTHLPPRGSACWLVGERTRGAGVYPVRAGIGRSWGPLGVSAGFARVHVYIKFSMLCNGIALTGCLNHYLEPESRWESA